MARRSKKQDLIDEKVRLLCRRCPNWGALERLAGVTDRVTWWRGKTEEQASAEIERLVRARVERGELDVEAHGH